MGRATQSLILRQKETIGRNDCYEILKKLKYPHDITNTPREDIVIVRIIVDTGVEDFQDIFEALEKHLGFSGFKKGKDKVEIVRNIKAIKLKIVATKGMTVNKFVKLVKEIHEKTGYQLPRKHWVGKRTLTKDAMRYLEYMIEDSGK